MEAVLSSKEAENRKLLSENGRLGGEVADLQVQLENVSLSVPFFIAAAPPPPLRRNDSGSSQPVAVPCSVKVQNRLF